MSVANTMQFPTVITKSDSGYVVRIPPHVFMSIVYKALHNFASARVILRVVETNTTLVCKLTDTPYVLLIENANEAESLVGKRLTAEIVRIELPNGTIYMR